MAKKQLDWPENLYVPDGCNGKTYIDGGAGSLKSLVDDFDVVEGELIGIYKFVGTKKVNKIAELV